MLGLFWSSCRELSAGLGCYHGNPRPVPVPAAWSGGRSLPGVRGGGCPGAASSRALLTGSRVLSQDVPSRPAAAPARTLQPASQPWKPPRAEGSPHVRYIGPCFLETKAEGC